MIRASQSPERTSSPEDISSPEPTPNIESISEPLPASDVSSDPVPTADVDSVAPPDVALNPILSPLDPIPSFNASCVLTSDPTPGPSSVCEQDAHPTETNVKPECKQAVSERYNSSQGQIPLQPISVTQQSGPAGDNRKPARLFPIFYSDFRPVGRGSGRRNSRRRSGRIAEQSEGSRRRYPRSIQPSEKAMQTKKTHMR